MRGARAMVATVVFAGAVVAFQIGKVAVAAMPLRDAFGLGTAALGALGAAIALLGVIASVPAGAAVAALGARPVLLAGLASTLAGAAGAALAGSFAALMTARAIEGLGFLCVVVAGGAAIDRSASGRARGIAYACWSCATPLGIAAAMVAGPHFATWHGLASFAALLAAVALALVAVVVPRDPRAHRRFDARAAVRGGRDVFGEAGPRAAGLMFALYSLMFFALFGFLPFLLGHRLQLDALAAGSMSGAAAAANAIGNLAAGALLARVRPAALVATAGAVMALCACGIFLPAFGAWTTFALCVAFSAVGGLLPATLLASAPLVSSAPARVPLTLGLLLQGSNTGQALGPVVVGVLIQHAGWPAAGAVVVGAGVLLVVGAGALDRALRAQRCATA